MDDELIDDLNDEILYEESNILDLVNHGLLESNYFNSFEWSNNCYERIKNNETFPLITSDALFENDLIPSFTSNLNDLNNFRSFGSFELNLLESKFLKVGGRLSEVNESNYIIDNPVDLFMNDILYGQIPTPETLSSLYKCFNLYYLSNGTLTLEDVFFGKFIKRAGNYAQRKTSKQVYSEFHFSVIREDYKSDFDLKNFALRYIDNNHEEIPSLSYFHEENINSFLKGYDRWKSKINDEKLITKTIEDREVTKNCLTSLGYKPEEITKLITAHFDSKINVESNLVNILQLVMDK
jgi:hypothetical protein